MHLGINLGCRRSVLNEIKNFPKLASTLYKLDGTAIENIERFALASFRFADFIPKKL